MPAITISLPTRELLLLEREAENPRQRSRIIAHLIRKHLGTQESLEVPARVCFRCGKVPLRADQELNCEVCEYALKVKLEELNNDGEEE